MDLNPDSPEYKEAYAKEMQRLEAEANKGKEKSKPEDVKTTSEAKAEAKADDAKTESADEIRARLEEEKQARLKMEKALKDTQRWAHENAAKVKKLEREAEDRKRQETAPDILKANPGLEDAIKHVAKVDKPSKEDPKEVWLRSVNHAIPDVESLLAEQAFLAKAQAKAAELGPEWDNPLTAIRELSELKANYRAEKLSQAAAEAARKDFQEKSKKRSAMDVPGGSGGKDTPQGDDAVKRYATMSKEEFAKERSRVMGF